MSIYALIENGQITEGPKNLPKSWRIHAGFDKAPLSMLLSLGWYPVEYVVTSYDNATHYLDGHHVDIQDDKVVMTERTKAFTQEQRESNIYNDWMSGMANTDSSMPRYLEDHIKDDHNGIAGNEFLQAKYDEKKLLRATKP